ncbi:MAG: hypothetical protein K8R69_00080 [Deltaproteobacteria bacterium]|nr:hypothetical protein [Deltaproteobacteria bacterium]
MTPPSAPSGSAARVLPPVPEGPAAPGPEAPEASAPGAFHGSRVLEGVLKKTGRVPTHPLTAKPEEKSPPSQEVTPQEARRAESFRIKGDQYFKKEDYKKALGYFVRAHKTNPGDARITLRLAKAEHALGGFFEAHDHYNEYLAYVPDSIEAHTLRLNVNQFILGRMKEMAAKIPKEQQAEFVKTGQALTLETSMDRAFLLARSTDQQIEGLRELEKKVGGLHGKSRAEKEKFYQGLMGLATETLALADLPPFNPKDAELIPKELGRLVQAVFGVLSRFAGGDSDPALKRLAPLFDAYSALSDGRMDDAVVGFELVRGSGLALLGEGDEEKGEALLKEKLEKVAKLVAEKKPEEAEKILQEEIPPGLADAYGFLREIEVTKLRAVSLASLQPWEDAINARHAAQAKEEDGFVGKMGQAWDIAFSHPTKLDLLSKEAGRDLALVAAVRQRLTGGKAITLKEALEDVVAKESGDLKDRAKSALDRAAIGSDPGTRFPLNQIIRYTGNPTADPDAAAKLMTTAASMGDAPTLAAILFAAVRVHSKDKSQRNAAEEGLKKLPPTALSKVDK